MKKLIAIIALLPILVFGKTLELNDKNTINFNDSFTSSYVAKKQAEAIELCNGSAGKDIYIVLYTPGGSISAGQLFFDTLKALPCRFHTLTIFSASMGYQTVQNLGKRYILPSGILMSHRAQISGLSGELGGELESILSLLNQNVTDMETVAANRIGKTLKEYRSIISDELWLTGSNAVKRGHADEVVLAKCDQSLMGTREQTFRTFFGTIVAEFSECPLIVGALSVKFGDAERFRNYSQNIMKRIEFKL